MLKLANGKITKGLSAVVCATVLFSASAQASQNVNEVSNYVATNTLESRQLIASRSSSHADALKEFAKVLELLKANTSGFYAPLTQNMNGVFDTLIGVIKTAASGGKVDFDLTSIGPRIQLAIAATKNIIAATVKDPQKGLYYKEEKVLIKYGFGVTGAILDMVNPFTKTSTIKSDMTKLDRILKEALAGPNMTDDSVANTNVKEEFETLLRNSRDIVISKWTYLQNEPEFVTFKKQITKSTIQRLDPVLRYGELRTEMAKLQASYDKIQQVLQGVGYENITSSLLDRIKLAKELAQAGALNTSEFKNKSPKLKLELTKELLRIAPITLNPVASLADVYKAKEDVKKAVQKVRDSVSADDKLASKSSKDILLRELHIARFLKFNKTARKGWDVNSELDKVISSLNWTSININATQAEVDNGIKTIKAAMKKAIDAPNVW